MAHKKLREPRPEEVQNITAYIRAGGFPRVAAAAAGVSRALFAGWMRQGKRHRKPAGFRALYRAVCRAAAEARLKAETEILEKRPLDWLRYGPGRESADGPGWTAAARPRVAGAGGSPDPLSHPGVQALVAGMLGALAAHPEARAAAVAVVEELGLPGPGSEGGRAGE